MASAIDCIVQLTRLRDGTRRVTHITEVQGMEGDVITLQDIFLFDFGMGVDEHGKFRGHLKATGTRPKFAEKLADQGIRLGPEVFQPERFARTRERRPVTRARPSAPSRSGRSRRAGRRVPGLRRRTGAFAQDEQPANGFVIRQIDGTDPENVGVDLRLDRQPGRPRADDPPRGGQGAPRPILPCRWRGPG